MNVSRNAAVYFALQGIAVFVWWLLLFFVPASRKFFLIVPDSEISLLAFWLPDLVFLAGGSLAASWLGLKKSEHCPAVLWMVTGAVSYATFYCLALAFFTDVGWLGVTLMFPAMIWSGNFAIALSPFGGMIFRQAKKSSASWILLKTFTQILFVWTLILFVFPFFIVGVEDKIGIVRISFPFQKVISSIIFIGVSLIGLHSSFTMSKIGEGTPLPLDATNKLVVSGIYSYVRNPMAISGIAQGLAVALFLGSPLVLAYALMGAFIWQFIFRPLEEEDLRRKFSADYQSYCDNVRCWIPRHRAYQIESTAASSNSIDSPSGKI